MTCGAMAGSPLCAYCRYPPSAHRQGGVLKPGLSVPASFSLLGVYHYHSSNSSHDTGPVPSSWAHGPGWLLALQIWLLCVYGADGIYCGHYWLMSSKECLAVFYGAPWALRPGVVVDKNENNNEGLVYASYGLFGVVTILMSLHFLHRRGSCHSATTSEKEALR